MSPAKPATDPDSGIFIASMAQPAAPSHFQLEAADAILRGVKALGLTVPSILLATADRVVE